MWQRKQIENQEYFIDAEYDAEEHKSKISMSTVEESWTSEMSDDEIVNIIKELNPAIEAEHPADLIVEIMDLFDASRTDVEWSITERVETQFKLKISSTLGGTELKFEVILRKTDSSKILMLPLLIILQNQKHLLDELCKVLRRKDSQITEYKLNGAMVTSKSAETPEFHENLLNELFVQHLPQLASKSAKELFDRSVISYFNQVQPVVRKRKRETSHEEERQQKVPAKSADSIGAPISIKVTTEINLKPEEVTAKVSAAPKRTTSIVAKSKPIKKLKNF